MTVLNQNLINSESFFRNFQVNKLKSVFIALTLIESILKNVEFL